MSTRSETVARARELRSSGSTAVAARRRAETGAASVVLQRDSRAFGAVRVVLAGVAMTFVDGLLNGLVVEATVGDCEAADDQEDQDKDDDDDDGRRVLTLGFLVVDVAGVQCEVSWGSCAGVERRAAVRCVHGTDALLNPVHDSGGHGHVETGSRGGGVGGARRSRVVAAGVNRLKMHVRGGSLLVFCVC